MAVLVLAILAVIGTIALAGKGSAAKTRAGAAVLAATTESRPDRRPPTAAPPAAKQPPLSGLRADNGGHPFAGDRRLLTTISPNGDGLRDRAFIRFRLSRPAIVTLAISRTQRTPLAPVYQTSKMLSAGSHVLAWAASTTTPPGVYLCRLTVQAGATLTRYGAASSRAAHSGRTALAPVIRVQGIDAFLREPSILPGGEIQLMIAADAPALSLRFYRFGGTASAATNTTTLAGDPVGRPSHYDWRPWRSTPHTLRLRAGHWPSGLYYIRLHASDGRTGFVPLVISPAHPGANSHVAIVLPTYTWQAYNFYDSDGDGYGDTWYSGWEQRHVNTARPYLNRGLPLHFADYDAPLLRWLDRHATGADYLSDEYLERTTGPMLRKTYDLIVFEGHEEYVTTHTYDAIERYRDLGGHLIFLSANNFFWHITRTGHILTRTAQWRQLGRPEAALIGAQYRANDGGRSLGAYRVKAADKLPWLFVGCNLQNGDTFGRYGVEIDARASTSPPQTIEVAVIPNIYGPGIDAEMTYYETSAGAMVFDAGALNFGASALSNPTDCLLQNLYNHLNS